jgi:hypothetical protein
MIRYSVVVVGALVVLGSVGLHVVGQLEPFDGFVLSDLQLISQESRPTWSPRWTGPIQAATILAWFRGHGYPDFVPDLTGDGVIDELDTIELADRFGRGPMQAESPIGTNDARLVIGLARYVADQYPDEFVIKIYDTAFPAEFAAEWGAGFAPDAIPGIELRLETEPTLDAYKLELEGGEGVILGLEEEHEQNTYLTARSLTFEPTEDGYTAVDLAWAEEDRWETGLQGQVLDTVAKMDDRLYVDFRWGWTPVEFLLGLSPLQEPEITSGPHDCPETAIAYDLTTTTIGAVGDVVIEECVIREGSVDTYIYTVLNVSFEVFGCGICLFGIPQPGLTPVANSQPPGWFFVPTPHAFVWVTSAGSCGLLPGQSAVFSVSLPGPTTDTPVLGGIGNCVPASPCGMSFIEIAPVRTTGPGLPSGDCPDLVVTIDDWSCSFSPETGQAVIWTWVTVQNVGTAPVTDPFFVRLQSDTEPSAWGHWGIPTSWLPIHPGDIRSGIALSYSLTVHEPPCDSFTVIADSLGNVSECDEDNNRAFGSVCCEDGGEPDNGDGCPDLTIEIISRTCEAAAVGAAGYRVDVTVEVTNIGTATATGINLHLSSSVGSGTAMISSLAPTFSDTRDFSFVISPNTPPDCPVGLEAIVDYTLTIPECDEDNNDDTDSVYCPNCK